MDAQEIIDLIDYDARIARDYKDGVKSMLSGENKMYFEGYLHGLLKVRNQIAGYIARINKRKQQETKAKTE